MQVLRSDLIDFDAYLQHPPEAAKIRPAREWLDSVVEFYKDPTKRYGARLPWSKTHDFVRIRPYEVSIWSGYNGHGKSLLLSQVVLSLAAQGERICVASLEMKPEKQMARMVRQACATAGPSHKDIVAFHAWTDDLLWLYDQQGVVKHDRMISVARYCSQELGITQLVIDSLMKLGIRNDDYSMQKDVVNELCSVALDTGLHIHLVAHSRKGQSEYTPPGKHDVKGASEITDQVDNVFTVWRNKPKEESRMEHALEPDAKIAVDKQRHGEWEGAINLWFDPQSQTYSGHELDIPKHYSQLWDSLK